jgi:hypothetical protein
MTRSSLCVALFLFSSVAVGTANAATKFEGVSIPGTSTVTSGFFQINVATGEVSSVWGSTTTTFTVVKEAAPLPAGEYHLYVAPNPQADGNNYWMLTRLDANTGHVWSLIGGGGTAYSWTAVLPPK